MCDEVPTLVLPNSYLLTFLDRKISPSLNFMLFEVQSGTQKYNFFAFLPLKTPKNFRAFGAILNFFQIFSQFFSNSYLFPKISGIFIPMS